MSIESANLWNQFHLEFSKLAAEEAQFVRSTGKDAFLRAYSAYRRDEVILYNKANPEWGEHCLLNFPTTGIWQISSGVSENFQERFRTLASRGAVALGCPERTDPEDYWLHSLLQDLLEHESNLLLAGKKDEGGLVLRVCEASATFCARLERRALSLPSTQAAPPKDDSSVNNNASQKLAKFNTGARLTSQLHSKESDLSRYLDHARLTTRQYECASLRWEYRLSISEISKKLGLHRSTVAEYIKAAQAKIDASRIVQNKRHK